MDKTKKKINRRQSKKPPSLRLRGLIRSGFAIFERQMRSNDNMACVTILAWWSKFPSKWPRFWSKTNWKRFQRSWREKQFRRYCRKFWSILEIRGQCGYVATNMIAKYRSDRQFYVWHLVYLDRLFSLSSLTCRGAHVTAGWLAGIQM